MASRFLIQRTLSRPNHGISSCSLTVSETLASVFTCQRAVNHNGANSSPHVLPVPPRFQLQQRCWFGRKGAKMGRRLENLKEMAHDESHRQAQERRLAKKQRKKGKKNEEEEESSFAGRESDSDELAPLEEFESEDDFEQDEEDETPQLPDPKEVKQRMMRVVKSVEESFKSIRGGEPTPELFDAISVQAYGEQTPLSSVAQVVITSPTLATITCFDPDNATPVRNAIMLMLELNPQVDDDGTLRVPLPRPSMEQRQKTVKQLSKQAEIARTRIRGIRRGALNIVKKKGEKGLLEGISKDDAFRVDKEINAVTDQVIDELNHLVEVKQDRVMSV